MPIKMELVDPFNIVILDGKATWKKIEKEPSPDYSQDVKYIHLRPEIRQFAVAMELKLRTRDKMKGKKGWKECKANDLFYGLEVETRELSTALRDLSKSSSG